MISVVLTSFNEAAKLDRCLDSLEDFADEIIVVDLGSTDSSEEVCRKHEAKFIKHHFVSFVEQVRNFAISQASGDWILVLDPDEIVSPDLKEYLKQVVNISSFDAVNIPRKNVFFGKWIAYTNWWPDKHVRFFKKGQVKWNDKIHSYPEVSGKILNLAADKQRAIVHYGYDSVKEFMDRQNRYSSIEAQNTYDNGQRFSWTLFLWKPAREFLVRFMKHQGFRDGFYGFALVFLMMVYQAEVMVKLWELEKEK